MRIFHQKIQMILTLIILSSLVMGNQVMGQLLLQMAPMHRISLQKTKVTKFGPLGLTIM